MNIKLNMMKKQIGFTLIELMVAMVIGLIILLGLVSLFSSSSALNRAQFGLSVLQENGRYAISRLKTDIETAGRRHCASVAMPTSSTTNWDQGYEMSVWSVNSGVNFTNGLPNSGDINLDDNDADQLGDIAVTTPTYPMDSRYLLMGHECGTSACLPDETSTIGADFSTNFGGVGIADGNRAPSTDILTMRSLIGGNRITAISGNTVTFDGSPSATTGDVLVADCFNSYVAPATWSASTVAATGPLPSIDINSDARVFNMSSDFRTVSYFIRFDEDVNDSSRVISSLYRSENGVSQQLVEGVERFDVFYLAQLQTGHVVRLTADQVNGVSDGGDSDGDGAIDQITGCTIPPSNGTQSGTGLKIANNPGCLWRSIYAIEVHLLLNTVNNSSTENNDTFIYSPDGDARQDPSSGIASGLDAERMYRRQFTAVVPIRSYNL